MIERLKEKAGPNLIQRILIHHLEEMLSDTFTNYSKRISFDNEESYTKCDKFRSLLLKATTQYINFW